MGEKVIESCPAEGALKLDSHKYCWCVYKLLNPFEKQFGNMYQIHKIFTPFSSCNSTFECLFHGNNKIWKKIIHEDAITALHFGEK